MAIKLTIVLFLAITIGQVLGEIDWTVEEEIDPNNIDRAILVRVTFSSDSATPVQVSN